MVLHRGIELEVCHDIASRQAKGLAKYGTAVAANPLELKAWLQHAYEETLDQAIYLKRAIREMENAEVSEGGTRDARIETAAQSRPSLH